MILRALAATDDRYPSRLRERLGEDAPAHLIALGNLDVLNLPKTALFCSASSPGHSILAAYDQAARWRDAGRCIISGFHSPVEKECLRILLRGQQPIIICPARSLDGMRLSTEWKKRLMDNQLLILSPFSPRQRRVTASLARDRNRFVAALADEVLFGHVTPGGDLNQLKPIVTAWRIPHRGLAGPEVGSP